MADRPDIFLVILDGYAGRVSARRDQGIHDPQWWSSLAELGFQNPSSAWSSYPSTTGSVTSLLEMSYILHSGPGISSATQMALYETIAGDNALVRTLRSAGYRTTMVESGWSGSSCGPLVDHCVSSPLLDEATFWVLSQTILWPAVEEHFGYSFTAGARGVMAWMLENGKRIASDAKPDLVFAHVVAPHPPFFLSADCSLAYSPKRSGVTFARARDDLAEREVAYLEQTSCVDGFMTELARTLPPTSAIVFTADHGTDRRNQIVQPPEDWDQSELSERFNVLLSVRIPGCDVGEVVLLPNLFRRVLSCLATDKLADLPPRMFIHSWAGGVPSSIVEVEHQLVASLLESGQ
ncbi:MAG: sulfatase-like hydrolase/transferase [Acidimicrobiia bacterium]